MIVAGGIYNREDVQKVDNLGADGIQVATRFITTEECDADIRYKEAHLKAKESDIAIVKSPVGMPGRAIMNNQVAKRIVNIRLAIEMHNLRGERFVMFTPYYGFVQYLILNFCQCLFKLKCK